LICVVLLVGSVVFFRVDTVVVEGNVRYTAEEIVAASGVRQGDNLFWLNKNRIAPDILGALPYVGRVTITRKLPSTLRIAVQESTAVAVVQSGDEWWLIDSACKLLERGDQSLAAGRAEVLTLTLLVPAVGTTMAVREEDRDNLERLSALLEALNEYDVADRVTDFIDLTSENEIRFGFGENLTVILPRNANFSTKIHALCRALETLSESQGELEGTLELTFGDSEAHLLPDRWMPDTAVSETPADEEEETDAAELPPEETASGEIGDM